MKGKLMKLYMKLFKVLIAVFTVFAVAQPVQEVHASNNEDIKQTNDEISATIVNDHEYEYAFADSGMDVKLHFDTLNDTVNVNGIMYDIQTYSTAVEKQAEDINKQPITYYLEVQASLMNQNNSDISPALNTVVYSPDSTIPFRTSNSLYSLPSPVSGYSAYVHAYDIWQINWGWIISAPAITALAAYLKRGNYTEAERLSRAVIAAATTILSTAANEIYHSQIYKEYYQSTNYSNSQQHYIVTRCHTDTIRGRELGYYSDPEFADYGRPQ